MGSVRRPAGGALRPVLFAAAALAAVGCDRRPAPITIRLVDLFKPELLLGRFTAPPSPGHRTEWRFDAPQGGKGGPGRAWEAGPGVAGLEVRDGRLQGQTTTNLPLLHLRGEPGPDGNDVIEDVEIRLRASAGANLYLAFSGQERLDLTEVAQPNPVFWSFTT